MKERHMFLLIAALLSILAPEETTTIGYVYMVDYKKPTVILTTDDMTDLLAADALILTYDHNAEHGIATMSITKVEYSLVQKLAARPSRFSTGMVDNESSPARCLQDQLRQIVANTTFMIDESKAGHYRTVIVISDIESNGSGITYTHHQIWR